MFENLKRHKPFYSINGYKQIYKPKSKYARENGYVAEHRYKAEKKFGDLDGKVVHHKNGDKTDNRIRNLIPMTPKEHAKLHFQEKRQKQNF